MKRTLAIVAVGTMGMGTGAILAAGLIFTLAYLKAREVARIEGPFRPMPGQTIDEDAWERFISGEYDDE